MFEGVTIVRNWQQILIFTLSNSTYYIDKHTQMGKREKVCNLKILVEIPLESDFLTQNLWYRNGWLLQDNDSIVFIDESGFYIMDSCWTKKSSLKSLWKLGNSIVPRRRYRAHTRSHWENNLSRWSLRYLQILIRQEMKNDLEQETRIYSDKQAVLKGILLSRPPVCRGVERNFINSNTIF